MVSHREQATSLGPGSHTQPGRVRADIEQQLARLFGESLFGPWPELHQNFQGSGALPQRRRRHWPWVAALAVIIGIVLAGQSLLRPGRARPMTDERAHYAQELTTFLGDGNLERAAQFMGLVRGEQDELDPADPYRPLLVRAEAILYRYVDAKPDRLRRIERCLRGDSLAKAPTESSPELWLASLTVLSYEERAARLPVLERLRTLLPRDAEYYHVLATALESRGDISAAREAWQRSAKLGPGWLSHRFEQAEFERRHHNESAASKVALGMVRADPESAWSELATSVFHLSVAAPSGKVTVFHASEPRDGPAVLVFHGRLRASLEAARLGTLDQARQELAAAISAVNGGAPFVLDAFDWLLAADFETLARELTESPAWPRKSEVAHAKVVRLAERHQRGPTSKAVVAPAAPPRVHGKPL